MKKLFYFCAKINTISMNKEEKIKRTKINYLIQNTPKGFVLLSSWLASEGYPYELQQRYRESGWLKSIGKGAMIKTGDSLLLSGAIASLQEQSKLNIHFGGRSALGLTGAAHYLQINSGKIEETLFIENKSLLPTWFVNNQWDRNMKIYTASLFEDDEAGLINYQDRELTMKISNKARAIMECLSLCPQKFSLTEVYEIMEGLITLNPTQIQTLLEQCKSIKVKRLFLFFAERANHPWFEFLNTKIIDLGRGVRSLVKEEGVFVSKYQIVIPKKLIA